MKHYLAVCLFLVNITFAICQPNAHFFKTSHNFGQVANLNYPPASFLFKNTGDAPLAVLVVNKSAAVKVGFTKGFIQPGDSGRVFVLPNLNTKGPFIEQVSVMTNATNTPYLLEIRGEVISVQACFPNPDDWNLRQVIVTDIDTKEPIANVAIEFTHNMARKFNATTDKIGTWTGEVPIGQYTFDLTKNGYYPLKESLYVPLSAPILFFEMDMIPPAAPTDNISIADHVLEIPEETIEPLAPIENPTLLSTHLYAANNLVLLLDVSYSMKANNKIGLLKHSAVNLANILRSIDNVSIITYAGSPTLILKSVPGSNREEICSKIMALNAAGITNGVKGLESAYILANAKFIAGGNNQIILATDGKFTGGTQQPAAFKRMIADYAERGIVLSIIGFGVDNDAKSFMNEMAGLGKGSYIHVATKDDVSETLINEIKEKSRMGN